MHEETRVCKYESFSIMFQTDVKFSENFRTLELKNFSLIDVDVRAIQITRKAKFSIFGFYCKVLKVKPDDL